MRSCLRLRIVALLATGVLGSAVLAAQTPAVLIVVDGARPLQRFEGFGATTTSLVYGTTDFLTPSLRAQAIAAVYGQVGLTMGQVEPGIIEAPAAATDPWSQRRNDNDDPFVVDPAGFNWTASDAMRAAVIAPAGVYGLDDWSLANKINTRYALNYLEPFRTSDYRRYLEEAAEYTVAGLIRWRDAYGITPRWVAPWNEPTSGNGEIVGASTRTLVDLVTAIGRRMSDSGFASVKLVVPNEETVQRSLDVARAMLSDPDARRYVGAIGYHAYPYESPYSSVRQILEQSGRGRPVAAQIEVRRQLRELSEQYGVPVWMTEISEGPGNNDYPFAAFENVRARAIHIHDEILYAGTSAYYGMNAMWDRRSHEAHFAGRGIDFFSESSTIALVDTDAVYISGMGYAIGHYARAVDAGARVLASTSSDSLVQVTVFRNDLSGTLALVLINNAADARRATIALEGLRARGSIVGEQSTAESRWSPIAPRPVVDADSVEATLPAESVTTLVVPIERSSAVGPGEPTAARLRLSVMPSPSRDHCSVKIVAGAPGEATISIVGALGERVLHRSVSVIAGAQTVALDLAGIPSGHYRLTVSSAGGATSAPVIVVR